MAEQMHVKMNEAMSYKEDHHGLRGHVTIHRRNKETGEVALWYEDDNIIPISGYQWILMKMFGLNLDSSHQKSYEKLDQHTNLIIPDLNQSGSLQIGTDPNAYTSMAENISSNHIVQGFMVGNGGAGEDQMTAKNTDYSFTKLRNPIPFQQTQDVLPGSIAGKYCGKLRVGNSAYSKSYFIKKFEETPQIYHSWWKDEQRWDYVDPVTQNDLGPDAPNGTGKTNRIETYAECKLSLNETDCMAYFQHDGNTQTPAINELGLVAFDTTAAGTRNIMESLYSTHINPILDVIFNKDRSEDDINRMMDLVKEAIIIMEPILSAYPQDNIHAVYELFTLMVETYNDTNQYDFAGYMESLGSTDSIRVIAHYDQNGNYLYEEDLFNTYLADEVFDQLTIDEAQRIKLITYYTFKSIPIQTNQEILITYRIYAN